MCWGSKPPLNKRKPINADTNEVSQESLDAADALIAEVVANVERQEVLALA